MKNESNMNIVVVNSECINLCDNCLSDDYSDLNVINVINDCEFVCDCCNNDYVGDLVD